MAGRESRTLEARVHGRYLLEAPEAPAARPLIVGFHGYGQSAEQHLEELRRLPGAAECLLVAVQSLHLFYTRGGEVVGSWMTRLGREEAIADNVSYVAEIVRRVRAEHPAGGPLVYVGFSQGAAMAYRAAARSGHACHGLVVLGGDLPPDLSDDELGRLPPLLVARGKQDEWFTDEKLQRDLDRLARRDVPVRSLVFDGGHEWSEAFRSEAGAFLATCAGARISGAAEPA